MDFDDDDNDNDDGLQEVLLASLASFENDNDDHNNSDKSSDNDNDDNDTLFKKANQVYLERYSNNLMKDIDDDEYSKFRCNVCTKIYRTRHLLIGHFTVQHKDILSRVILNKTITSTSNNNGNDIVFDGVDETKTSSTTISDEDLAMSIAMNDYEHYISNRHDNDNMSIYNHTSNSNSSSRNNNSSSSSAGSKLSNNNIKQNNRNSIISSNTNKKGKSKLCNLYASDSDDDDNNGNNDDSDHDDGDIIDTDIHHNNDLNTDKLKQERLQKFLAKMDNIVANLNRMIVEGTKNYDSNIGANNETSIIDASADANAIPYQSNLLTSGILRNYQVGGMEWLVSLALSGFNGILADEMGLGKTIQVLAFLCKLFEKDKNLWGPHLIVCPLSVISTWINDVNKFCPDEISLHVHQGEKNERYIQYDAWKKTIIKNSITPNKKICIVLTTYNLVMNDINLFEKKNKTGSFKWKYLIIDEGHRLKNKASILYSVLGTLDTKRRLLLTGTPVQNNLDELWNLFSFILPDMFNHLSHYNDWFNKPFNVDVDKNDDDSDEDYLIGKKRKNASGDLKDKGFKINNTFNEDEKKIIISSLHRVIKPFILRRKKEDVAVDIPPKVEKTIYCQMSGLQHKLFYILKEVVNKNTSGSSSSLDDAIHAKANKFSMLSVSYNNMLMQLRKLCNHPFLILEDLHSIPDSLYYHYLLKSSGKLCMLNRLLKILLGLGHKVLIFSQMTTMIDILEGYLYNLGIGYQRLDGKVSTENRLKSLHAFNDPNNTETPVFLLSTRAGGVGINLQAADTVILFDSDWNPQQDLQAMSRAHRIGQTRSVLVLRLVSLGVSQKHPSIEERMLRAADKKLYAANTVLEDGKFDMGTIDSASDARSTKSAINFFLDEDDDTNRKNGKHKNKDEAYNDRNGDVTDEYLIDLCRRGHSHVTQNMDDNDNHDDNDVNAKIYTASILSSLQSCEKPIEMSPDLDVDWSEWLGTGRGSTASLINNTNNYDNTNDDDNDSGGRRLRKRNSDLNFNESFLANDDTTGIRKNRTNKHNDINDKKKDSKRYSKSESKSANKTSKKFNITSNDDSSDIADECVLCGWYLILLIFFNIIIIIIIIIITIAHG